MSDQRTLCHRCANGYRDAGYYLIRDYTIVIKDECDMCRRTGWVYKIWRRKGDKRGRYANKTLR
jgi:hypothetical protein